MDRPAAEIEPQERIFSSNWILPGPMRSSVSRSIRTLSDGSEVVEDFGMFGLFMFVDRSQVRMLSPYFIQILMAMLHCASCYAALPTYDVVT